MPVTSFFRVSQEHRNKATPGAHSQALLISPQVKQLLQAAVLQNAAAQDKQSQGWQVSHSSSCTHKSISQALLLRGTFGSASNSPWTLKTHSSAQLSLQAWNFPLFSDLLALDPRPDGELYKPLKGAHPHPSQLQSAISLEHDGPAVARPGGHSALLALGSAKTNAAQSHEHSSGAASTVSAAKDVAPRTVTGENKAESTAVGKASSVPAASDVVP